MNSSFHRNVDEHVQEQSACKDFVPISVAEFKTKLTEVRRDVKVRESETISLSPADAEFRSAICRVQGKSFEDLQALDILHGRLDETKVRQAIQHDSDRTHESVQTSVNAGGGKCGCHSSLGRESAQGPRSFRERYIAMRSSNHVALARVVGDATKSAVRPDDAMVRQVHRFSEVLQTHKLIEFLTGLFGDITILNGGTLSLSPTLKVLWGGELRIHVNGKISQHNSYTKYRFATFRGQLP